MPFSGTTNYTNWLNKQRVSLFKAGNIYWRLYQGALVPAPATPCFVELSHDDAKALLKDTGALFIRYTSDPCEKTTEWWYIVCDKYETKSLSSKTRQNIKRGKRSCSVRKIDGEWLADHGYECYCTAYGRYRNAIPESEELFRNNILSTIKGPFEYWGVFVEERLAGYCQWIVGENDVYDSVTKYNPAYLRHRTAYALISNLINHYVVERGMRINNGTRSIAHDTNYQDVLINLGFRKQFCCLNVVYQPWVGFIVKTLYPFRKFVATLPDLGPVHKMQSIVVQEELRRTFND